MAPRVHPAECFFRYVTPTEGDECWEWRGNRNPKGYGLLANRGTSTTAHRISYRIYVGDIPDGYHVDHLCRNPSCVNPRHLEAVTVRENNRRSDNFTGINARKTHCIRGHEFDRENTLIIQARSGPQRRCRTCVSDYQRQWRTSWLERDETEKAS